MHLQPDLDAFADRFAAGENQLVWTRLVADLDTPVSLMLKLTEARKDSFLLESVTGGEVRGRYSIMGMKPDVIWECRGPRARVNRSARFDPEAWEDETADPLTSLRALIAESRIDLPADLPPMAAGLFGYLGYDMVRLFEKLPEPNPDPLGLPDAVLVRPTVTAIFDNGVMRKIAQVALATFPSADSLTEVSGHAFRVSQNSGTFNLKAPGTGGAGLLGSQQLEASTVDLSTEFTGLITTQRAYSASSKIITTADEMLAELINIKR